MDTRTLLVNYLGAGVSQADAAAAAGCSESLVSQLLTGDASFAEQVRALKAGKVSKYVEMDEIADSTQHVALGRLKKVISLETRPEILMRAIDTLDRMKRRSAPATAGSSNNAGVNMVKIVLPNSVANRYTISVDTNNRVVQVDAHTMVPASGTQIAQMAEVVQAEQRSLSHERRSEAGILSISASEVTSPETDGGPAEVAGSGASWAEEVARAVGFPSLSRGRVSSKVPVGATLDTFDGTLGSVL